MRDSRITSWQIFGTSIPVSFWLGEVSENSSLIFKERDSCSCDFLYKSSNTLLSDDDGNLIPILNETDLMAAISRREKDGVYDLKLFGAGTLYVPVEKVHFKNAFLFQNKMRGASGWKLQSR